MWACNGNQEDPGYKVLHEQPINTSRAQALLETKIASHWKIKEADGLGR